jgi:hypothetical protein
MLDDLARESILVGTWEAYYDHDDKLYSSKNFPITAMIEQVGSSFRGIMVDGVTDFQHDYRTIVEAYEGRMSPLAKHFARRTLEKYPDYKIESSMPAQSRIEGKILGDEVSFTKTYLGPCLAYGNTGFGRMLIRRVDRHRVSYQGILTASGGAIHGRWTIRGGGFLGLFRRTLGTGSFVLFRKK